MILRRGEVGARDPGGSAPRLEAALGDAGGLGQFGVNLVTLAPGQHSSDRHWHETEEEFLYMLDGRLVVVEDTGETEIGPGDACVWPAGVANAHHVRNRSARPATYLMVGTRPERDVVHYPDSGRTLRSGPECWRITDSQGRILDEGRD